MLYDEVIVCLIFFGDGVLVDGCAAERQALISRYHTASSPASSAKN